MSTKVNHKSKTIDSGITWILLLSLEVVTSQEYFKRLNSDPDGTPPPLATSPNKMALVKKLKRMKS